VRPLFALEEESLLHVAEPMADTSGP
jgi:hypothetical protein